MAPNRAQGRILAACLEARFDVVMSLDPLAGIGHLLGYPKIYRKLK